MLTEHKEITAVLLAGGRGNRMGELTIRQQKCMLEVDNAPILEHILNNLNSAFSSVKLIIATGHQADSITQKFGSSYQNIAIEYVHSSNQLETRKRLQLAKEKVFGPFLYIAGDVISHPTQLVKVAETFEKEQSQGVIGVMSGATDHQPAVGHALITVDAQNHATQMDFPSPTTWTEYHLREMGIAFYSSKFFDFLSEAEPHQTYLSQTIVKMIANGSDFLVETYKDRWYHFVKPDDLKTTIVFNHKT